MKSFFLSFFFLVFITPFIASQNLLAVMTSTNSSYSIQGTVLFTPVDKGGVDVYVSFTGAQPKKTYSLQIREYGDISDNTANYTGSLWTLSNNKIFGGCYPDTNRTIGSLGNVTASVNGSINVIIFSELLSVFPGYPGYPGGRSVVLVDGSYNCSYSTSDPLASHRVLSQGVLGWAENSQPTFPSRSQTAASGDTQLICYLTPTSSTSSLFGFVYFQIKPNTSDVYMLVNIYNLDANSIYSMHIHQYGDISDPSGFNVGPHFDVDDHTHGCPQSPSHHLGDLGNIKSNPKGTITDLFLLHNISLITSDDTSILARALVLNSGDDDCSDDPNDYNRIAQCVIGTSQFYPFTLPGSSQLSSAISLSFSVTCLLFFSSLLVVLL